ncbi:DegT/DnrJ/EryC1/StrS family aminotransferase [Sodalinema gerasimenkoae]|uniref:DegT/DnrJ/EryC1/StrS family aminotransferase n=1 Tax=Sodalinema gerasimenkoae TaxID=2862348 RepID=UPI0013592375|nr:DegT/DnrJ/EryC1/StrS family aminotransferase [Sodalinema gerasimenkoae]
MTVTPIPQTNPKASYLSHKAEIDTAIQRTLDSGWYILGSEVQAFEQEFATYIGTQHALGVSSGTDGIELALRACDIGSGDIVLTTSHTAVATVAAIELAGATPLLIDINPKTFNLDPNHLQQTLSQLQKHPHLGQPKAIIPVHLYGHPADLESIQTIAQHHQLRIIEDCSQAHGATLNNRRLGTWGDLAVFSLYPTKNLGAFGDAGIIVTQNSQLIQKLHSLRQYGWGERYISDIPGMNARLDPLQAAILRVKLQHLDADNQRRQDIAQQYNHTLSHLPLQLPQTASNASHVYHQYVIRTPERDSLRTFLKERQIGTLIHYPLPVHQQPAYQGRVTLEGASLPQTEQICREIVSLPMYPQLTDLEVQRISDTIIDWTQQANL